MSTTQISIKGFEFPSASAAIQHADASGRGEAIALAGRVFVVEKAEADRIAALGAGFAYLGVHHMPDGTDRVVTVPIN